jgi:hypothetical protein
MRVVLDTNIRLKFHLEAETIVAILGRIQRRADFVTPAIKIRWIESEIWNGPHRMIILNPPAANTILEPT